MKILKDQNITIETAHLAYRKGFNIPVQDYYIDHRRFKKDLQYIQGIMYSNYNNRDDFYSAPSQSLLRRWLREVHGIQMVIMPKMTPSETIVFYLYLGKPKNDFKECFKTFEECLEHQLQFILETLKNPKIEVAEVELKPGNRVELIIHIDVPNELSGLTVKLEEQISEDTWLVSYKSMSTPFEINKKWFGYD